MLRILRFPDLQDAGIVDNRATLSRWIKDQGFPPGVMLGPNTRGWIEADIVNWVHSRPAGEDLRGGL